MKHVIRSVVAVVVGLAVIGTAEAGRRGGRGSHSRGHGHHRGKHVVRRGHRGHFHRRLVKGHRRFHGRRWGRFYGRHARFWTNRRWFRWFRSGYFNQVSRYGYSGYMRCVCILIVY
jgi:hypothetical protein